MPGNRAPAARSANSPTDTAMGRQAGNSKCNLHRREQRVLTRVSTAISAGWTPSAMTPATIPITLPTGVVAGVDQPTARSVGRGADLLRHAAGCCAAAGWPPPPPRRPGSGS